MSNVLVSELLTMLGPPEHTDNVPGYLDGLAKLTNHFGTSVLAKAAERLIPRSGRKWPTTKEIVDVCADTAETASATNARQPRKNQEQYPWEQHARWAREWAEDFCRETKIGRQAFDEGWGRPLFLHSMSFAREAYRRNVQPNRDELTLTADWLTYYRGSADLDIDRETLVGVGKALRCQVAPKNLRWLDRVALLKEPAPDAPKAALPNKLNVAGILKPMPSEDFDPRTGEIYRR